LTVDWKENGENDINNVFQCCNVDVEPKLKTGETILGFIAKNLVYPIDAKEEGIQGKVIVKFMIMEDGSTGRFELLKSVHPLLDNEALRTIKLTQNNWTPGEISNNQVKVEYTIPIDYKIY
jgi:TonB family protein